MLFGFPNDWEKVCYMYCLNATTTTSSAEPLIKSNLTIAYNLSWMFGIVSLILKRHTTTGKKRATD
jgi:hypothetical protein